MMVNRDDLVDEVLRNMEGPAELAGTLQAAVQAGDTALVVNGAGLEQLKPGVFEVGSELIYVQTISPESGILAGCVRGYLGTTAATHAAGAVVRVDPATPRISVIRALNDALAALHPRVYAVAQTQFPTVDMTTAYDLPATTLDVLQVDLTVPGVGSAWTRSFRWKYVANAPTSSSTGKVVHVFDNWHGADCHVTYMKAAGLFSENTATNEDFVTATGLPAWTRELVTLGASFRLASTYDPVSLEGLSGDAAAMAQQNAYGAATRLAQHLYSLYSVRLQEAEARLRSEFNVGSIHYEW